MFRYLDGVLGERLAAKLEASGFAVLGWYDGGARSFYCANKPINSAADLVGQKIRVQPSETYIDMVTRLGAKPVTVPFKEVLDALQQKKVDCAENNMPSYEATGHYKEAKYLYLTNHVVSPEALVVSTKLWNALSTGDKALFKKAGQKSALVMRDLWTKRVASARETVAKEGVQIIAVKDYAPFVRKMGPMYSKYLADPAVRAELYTIISDQSAK